MTENSALPGGRCITRLALIALATGWSAGGAAHAQRPAVKTIDYVIAPGDTCAGIARRLYDDGSRWDVIHEFNPRLGPELPHRLVPGETLTLPPSLPPDAWVTAVVRRVEHRTGTADDWRPASTGTPLAVGNRVSTHPRAAAELTFRDDSHVELQQNTLLVIYGRTADETRRAVNAVRLSRGTLRSRLADLRGGSTPAGGPTLRVESASAIASLGAGDAVMSGDGEASAVSNLAGGPVQVTGVGGRGAVAVGSGMGTKVVKGRAPAPPRPLPDAPTWTPGLADGAWAVTPDRAVIELRWAPIPGAARYRLGLTRDGQRFAAADLPPTPPEQILTGLPAGAYAAELMVTDGDGLVSRPSAPHRFTIAAVSDGLQVPTGARLAGCHPPGAPAPDVVIGAGEVELVCGGQALTVVGVAPAGGAR